MSDIEVINNAYGKRFLHNIKNDYYYLEIPRGVAVLCELGNKYVLVSQYRLPLNCTTLELVCGGINKNESPEEAAIREVKEETGYNIKDLYFLGNYASSPGNTTEMVYLFKAVLSEKDKEAQNLDIEESLFNLNVVHIDNNDLYESILKLEYIHPFIPLSLLLSEHLE